MPTLTKSQSPILFFFDIQTRISSNQLSGFLPTKCQTTALL